MRLDKYLKVSRIIKRRTVANQVCKAGKIFLNGKIAKSSSEVKVDDIIEVFFYNKTLKVKVTKLNDSSKKDDASENYIILN